jgi:c-di-GMP-related signal transduction protein
LPEIDQHFIKYVVTIVREADLPPLHLEIEVTESVEMRNAELVRERISLLRKLGIRFAMDDFGAGYSNLSTMARLPFDTVKLDRSLAAGVSKYPEKQTILRLALRLANELGFETVVEGIETVEDLRFVAENGATMVQGYIFSPAVPLEVLEELVVLLRPSLLASSVEMAAEGDRAERHVEIIREHHARSVSLLTTMRSTLTNKPSQDGWRLTSSRHRSRFLKAKNDCGAPLTSFVIAVALPQRTLGR